MARHKNKRITRDDLDYLRTLQEEYENYGGWDTELNGNVLTIFALHRKFQRRKDNAHKDKKERNKRSEKFERRDK